MLYSAQTVLCVILGPVLCMVLAVSLVNSIQSGFFASANRSVSITATTLTACAY